MKTTKFTQSLSILISSAMVFSSLPVSAAGPAAAMPDFVKTLTPPSRLGYLDSFYQGKTDKPVILIQDLHANFGVQSKINHLLEFYEPQLTAGGHSMVLGIEGAWGKLDLSDVRRMAEKPLRASSDFLLKNGEISGMEYFAALSKNPVEFYGIDNPEDYFVHLGLFRKSLMARLQLAVKIRALRDAVSDAKIDGSSDLRNLWKIGDDFHAGKMGLEELSKKLNTPLTNYGQAEAALAKAQSVAVEGLKGDKAFYMKNVVQANHDLELLERLLRQQLTMEEVQYVAQRLPGMLKVVQGLLPGENMKLWEDTVRSAIDHYAVALLRNQPMASHAEDLATQYPNDSVVIVTGGFHTAGITEDLKSKHISYVVIAPIVEGQSVGDERMYLTRMMGLHVTREQIADARSTFTRESTLPALQGLVAKLLPRNTVPKTMVPEVAMQAEGITAVQTAYARGIEPGQNVFPESTDQKQIRNVIIQATLEKGKELLASIGSFLNSINPFRGLREAIAAETADREIATVNAKPMTTTQVSWGTVLAGAAVTAVVVGAVLHGVSIHHAAEAANSSIAMNFANSSSMNASAAGLLVPALFLKGLDRVKRSKIYEAITTSA